MSGAEGVDVQGRSANHTMNQSSTGAIQGSSSTGNRQGTGMNVGRTVNRGSYASGGGGGGGGSGGGSSLTFPSNLGSDPTQMNMMMFTAKEITGGSGDSRTITFRKSRAPVIALPIPASAPCAKKAGKVNPVVIPAPATLVAATILDIALL